MSFAISLGLFIAWFEPGAAIVGNFGAGMFYGLHLWARFPSGLVGPLIAVITRGDDEHRPPVAPAILFGAIIGSLVAVPMNMS